MSNAIQFLESLGASPASASRDPDAYARALSEVDVDEAQHRALIGRDADALARLLEGRAQMLCMVSTPDGGETQDEPDKSDEDGDELQETEDAPGRSDRPD
jgi:hypothetical protein